jgi:aspartyl/asparaginyl-tRNA synthetase
MQGVLTETEGSVSNTMVRWAEGISREAIVLVEGKVKAPPENQGEIKSTTVHARELQIEKVTRAYPCRLFHADGKYSSTSSLLRRCTCRSRSRTPARSASASALASTTACSICA